MGAPAVSNVLEKARKLLGRKSVALAAALLISLLAVAAVALPRFTAQPVPEITYSEFSRELAERKVSRVLVQDGGFFVSLSDRTVFVSPPASSAPTRSTG
jgi:cell division protease FtsH